MKGRTITVNSRKFDNSIHKTWTCELIEESPGSVVLLGRFEKAVDHPDLGHISAGTFSHEYFWFDRWYSIFRFYEPDRTFRNFYFNINTPAMFDGTTLDYVDLDVDVVQWPDGTFKILDEMEFESNRAKFNYPEYVTENIQNALSIITELVKSQNMPYSDLSEADFVSTLEER